MSAKTDRLYRVDSVPEDFDFNERVVEVFDDMLDRSIPFYREVIKAISQLLAYYLEDGDTICDLGCATGTPLLEFARLLQNRHFVYVGLDTSPAMLEKAQLKTELYSHHNSISFYREDITSITRPNTGAFLLNYTLQFIRPIQRQPLLERLCENLRPGGMIILSEKTICDDKWLNRLFIDLYHRFKRERGYSELEIARKREALENILIPFSVAENRMLLQESGFEKITPFFQWFNFSSFVAFKPK